MAQTAAVSGTAASSRCAPGHDPRQPVVWQDLSAPLRIRTRGAGNRGQALTEMLILLPVILLLLVAAADMGKLFVISGKSEIASRYIALRWFRHEPFQPLGSLYPEPADPLAIAGQVQELFFAGTIDDDDRADDVMYREMRRGGLIGGGDFRYDPPVFEVGFWDAMIYLLSMGTEVLPVRANRVSFTYDLPYFPYGREHPLQATQKTGPPFWGADDDPLGPYPLFTAKGDFVVIAESFYGGGGQAFLDVLQQYGLVRGIPQTVVDFALATLLFVILFLAGGG